LKPFYADPSGTFWTSATVRDQTKFGYTYPELQSNDVSAVRSAINTLYGSSSGQTSKTKREAHEKRMDSSVSVPSLSTTTPSLPNPTPSYSSASSNYLYHLNIRAPKNGLESTFFIYFFSGGPISDDPKTWPQDPNLLGSHSVISMKVPDNMPAVQITGVVPLNNALEGLISKGALPDLGVDAVTALLKLNLVWRIVVVSISNGIIADYSN
jgi:tyrosinase